MSKRVTIRSRSGRERVVNFEVARPMASSMPPTTSIDPNVPVRLLQPVADIPTIPAPLKKEPIICYRPERSDDRDVGEKLNWRETARGCITIATILIAGFCFYKALPASWFPSTPHARGIASHPITQQRMATRNITEFDVGMRAMGKNPVRDQVETAPEPDPVTSRKLVLRMKKASGRSLFIKLLRSLEWIESVGVEEGGSFHLNLPEMGAVGDAVVEAILPSPTIEEGPGNVVTGTFAHEADPEQKILSVTFSNGSHIQGVTDNHPVYSVELREFVPIGAMHEGAFVKVNDGVTKISRIESRFPNPGEMLYNLETHNEHVFQVTTAGILVHNSCADDLMRLKVARQLGNRGGRIFEMSDYERRFVSTVLDRKQNLQVFRTNQRAGMGDFIVIDRSNAKNPVAWFVELKTRAGAAHAGEQFTRASEAAKYFGLKDGNWRTMTGNIDELMNVFTRGRATW